MDHAREFQRTIQREFHHYHTWQVFADFCELSAAALYNQLVRFDQEREQRYLEIIGRYEELKERHGMARLLAITTRALESGHQDFLGQMFMQLELGNHWHGQFFTPYHLCHLMAQLTFGDEAVEKTKRGEIVSIQEPACGGGAMVIAIAEHVERSKGDVRRLQVHATDLDRTAANMAYIQFTMLGIPAAVHTGNTLSMEVRDTMVTPAWVWQAMEQQRKPVPVSEPVQLGLFGDLEAA